MTFTLLWLFILLAYLPFLKLHMVYEEQPIIYLANQKITSLYSFLQVYLHPAQLEIFGVPFFRPSGHFLLYQLITPFVGWHNTQAFLVLNYFFLALCCCLMLRFYKLFFPSRWLGGYVACGIFLMHPTLMLVHGAVMHSEFAFIFFALLTLYCFTVFCQKNPGIVNDDRTLPNKNYGFFILSLTLFAVSITFKELSIMIGPVMIVYFCQAYFKKESFAKFMQKSLWRREPLQIMLIIMAVTAMLASYISMSWPGLIPKNATSSGDIFYIINHFFKIIFGLWTAPEAPAVSPWFLQAQFGILIIGFYITFFARHINLASSSFIEKKSFLFLLMAAAAFLFIPVLWATGAAWHISVTLVFTSLLLGFSFESICQFFIADSRLRTTVQLVYCLFLVLLVCESATVSAKVLDSFTTEVDKNAVFNPPAIKDKLNAESVLIVEDSTIHSSYFLGDAIYPLEPFQNSIDIHRLLLGKPFYQYQAIYGGTLFRYAYLLPDLHEELYPFQVNSMEKIPNITIYHWLQHFNNIFCVGYDKKGIWSDKTLAFKVNLMREQVRRHMKINPYQIVSVKDFNSNSKATVLLPFAEASYYCQYRCDINPGCKSFTYRLTKENGATCYFEDSTVKQQMQACLHCESYNKKQLGSV
jgi:hypothetical protein